MPSIETSGGSCRPAHRFEDPARDSRSWILPAPADRQPAAPSSDLRELGLQADASGVCVTFTTGAPVAAGTELSFVMRGPMVMRPNGGGTSSAYGIVARLREDGLAMYFGLNGKRKNRLKGTWVQQGNSFSIAMPRSELDRAPTNMPNRPPLPLAGFTFEARVNSPYEAGKQEADFLPQERAGALGIVDGRICPAPCSLPPVAGP